MLFLFEIIFQWKFVISENFVSLYYIPIENIIKLKK